MARGVLKVEVRADVAGPLAGGAADSVLATWAENTAARLGGEGVTRLRGFRMDKSGRARGGFQAHLAAVRESPGVVRIKGPMVPGVAWAPWLEGTSRRNQSTGFRGYHLFAKTRAALDQRAAATGEEELARLMPELGGTP